MLQYSKNNEVSKCSRKSITDIHVHQQKDLYNCSSEFTQFNDEIYLSEDDLIFKIGIEDKNFNSAIERSRQEEEDILVRQLLIQKNYNDFVKQKELNSCYFNKENDEETEYEYSDSDCEYSESE
jgi:hypothetical protein